MIDTHCHLTWPDFDSDRNAAIDRARAAGVGTMITIGAGQGIGGNARAVALAEQHECLYAAVGLHPHDAKLFTPAIVDELEALARYPKVVPSGSRLRVLPRPPTFGGYPDSVVAIGEIGLDYHYDFSDRANQREAFAALLDLAQRLQLPIIIHQREAEKDLLATLDDFRHGRRLKGVLHCFGGTLEFANAMLSRGFNLGIGGVVTFKNAQALRDVVKAVPLDRIVLETDAPYLAPVPYRGKRNEPACVTEVAREIARIKDFTVEEVAETTSATARKIFYI